MAIRGLGSLRKFTIFLEISKPKKNGKERKKLCFLLVAKIEIIEER